MGIAKKINKKLNTLLIGPACEVMAHNETSAFGVYVPDVYYFSWFLGLGTLGLSFFLKDCVNTPYGFSWMRKSVSDFAVITGRVAK